MLRHPRCCLSLITTRHCSFLVFSGGNDRAVLGFLRALASCGERAHIIARTSNDRILRTTYRQDVKWTRPDHLLSTGIFADCIRRVRDSGVVGELVILPSTELSVATSGWDCPDGHRVRYASFP